MNKQQFLKDNSKIEKIYQFFLEQYGIEKAEDFLSKKMAKKVKPVKKRKISLHDISQKSKKKRNINDIQKREKKEKKVRKNPIFLNSQLNDLFTHPETGEKKTMKEWCDDLGIQTQSFYSRLDKFGPDSPKLFNLKYQFNIHNFRAWGKEYNISIDCARQRYYKYGPPPWQSKRGKPRNQYLDYLASLYPYKSRSWLSYRYKKYGKWENWPEEIKYGAKKDDD